MHVPLTQIACPACMCPLGLLFARSGVSMTPCRPPQTRTQVRHLRLVRAMHWYAPPVPLYRFALLRVQMSLRKSPTTKCGSFMTLARPLPLSLIQYCFTLSAWPMELASEACYSKFLLFLIFFLPNKIQCSRLRLHQFLHSR